MIAVAYYVGLVIWSVPFPLLGFLSEEREELVGKPLFGLLVLYLILGGYLFGWVLGLANVAILIVVGNILNAMLEPWIKRRFPHLVYREWLSLETRGRLRRFGLMLGINRPKNGSGND